MMTAIKRIVRGLSTGEAIEGFFAVRYAKFAKENMRIIYEQIAKDVAGQIKAGTILDVGTGPGIIPIEIAKLAPKIKVIGLDLSETMVEIASENAREEGVAEQVSFKLGDAAEMPFEDSSFDFIVSSGSLHHWNQPIKVFNEIYRVLKDGGEALIGDLRRDSSKEEIDEIVKGIDSWIMRLGVKHSVKESYTSSEISKLLDKTNFTDCEVKEEGVGMQIRLRK